MGSGLGLGMCTGCWLGGFRIAEKAVGISLFH